MEKAYNIKNEMSQEEFNVLIEYIYDYSKIYYPELIKQS